MKKWKPIVVVASLLLPLIAGFALTTTAQAATTATKTTTTTKKVKKAVKKSTKKPHYYLIVMGHGAGDPGARGNGTTEAKALRKVLLPQLRKYAKQVKHSKVTFYNRQITSLIRTSPESFNGSLLMMYF
ncbi:hypothetical protein H3M12_04225 [Levilactobacillus suantsaii]|uniref:N-acetylmuramoyl-L-alanine amidase n=1 Tax=Levilactobacillus suantsaii TaxID=2292255 RepID=UPI0015F5E046|nr:N-acetylmuramoyl-L-alanine amidase [Levilactobacillus suantsaii]QMU08866.1 hypothetical protein H3M12_04225 [Levilactobacillus suantsaii]